MILTEKRRFDRAAKTYDQFSQFQDGVGKELRQLLERYILPWMTSGTSLQFLDLGCGTGTQTAALAHSFPAARLFCMDLSSQMLAMARSKMRGRPFLGWCGTMEHLPLPVESIDLVFSNLSLQWVGELESALTEVHRVLKRDGFFAFTILGAETLWELGKTVQAIFPDISPAPPFKKNDLMRDILGRIRFTRLYEEMESRKVGYANLPELLRTIKGVGGSIPRIVSHHSISPKEFLKQVESVYDTFHRKNGMIPATYQMMWGVFQKQ